MSSSLTGHLYLLLCSLTLSARAETLSSQLTPVALRCEYRPDPLGIDEPHPRLTWQVESSERGQKQTAYQVLVATDEKLLQSQRPDLWDSGKVLSDQTVNVVYGGKPLGS